MILVGAWALWRRSSGRSNYSATAHYMYFGTERDALIVGCLRAQWLFLIGSAAVMILASPTCSPASKAQRRRRLTLWSASPVGPRP